MNQELIEQLMEECTEYWTDKGDIYFDKEKFAALVAATEREKVAKQWEQWHGFDKHTVAAFIRARGETK